MRTQQQRPQTTRPFTLSPDAATSSGSGRTVDSTEGFDVEAPRRRSSAAGGRGLPWAGYIVVVVIARSVPGLVSAARRIRHGPPGVSEEKVLVCVTSVQDPLGVTERDSAQDCRRGVSSCRAQGSKFFVVRPEWKRMRGGLRFAFLHHPRRDKGVRLTYFRGVCGACGAESSMRASWLSRSFLFALLTLVFLFRNDLILPRHVLSCPSSICLVFLYLMLPLFALFRLGLFLVWIGLYDLVLLFRDLSCLASFYLGMPLLRHALPLNARLTTPPSSQIACG